MTPPEAKLRTLDDLAAELASWQHAGLTAALANGAFDLLHVGHLRYLTAARALCDRLVVAVNSDASVRAGKGPLRPLLPEGERVEILSHLWMVDRMVLFDDVSVADVLVRLRPDVHAKGTDYRLETVPERAVVAAYGGRTVICGDPKDHSTTDVVATILARFGQGRS